MAATFCYCKKSPLWVCGNHSTELSTSILHGWIFWEMASTLCWKIHCGVQCAHLLCNGNNSCCLCLAFTVRFIYKHQLPMVLEDSTAENPLYLFVVIILQTLYEYTACLDILGNGIISHFGVYSAHLLCNGNNSCCLCLAFTVIFIYKHQLPTAKSVKLKQIWCTIIFEPKMQITAQSTLSIPSNSALQGRRERAL